MKCYNGYITIVFLLLLCGCSQQENDDLLPPELAVPPVNLGQVTFFIPFGSKLSPTQQNPALEYVLADEDEEVVSSTLGQVTRIFANGNVADLEIHIKPSKASEWTLIYDHVLEPTVAQGDYVAIGFVLGKVGVGNRTELQLNKGNGPEAKAHCPMDFGTTEFNEAHGNYFEEYCLSQTVIP